MKTIVLLSILLINLNMFGMDEPCLPNDVRKMLNEHAAELQALLKKFNKHPESRRGRNVAMPEWLSNWLIKFGIERVVNRNRLHDVIQKYNLNLLSVAEKYLYHVPGKPDAVSNENYLVIARNVYGREGRGQQINLDQAKQLWKLALKASHYNLHPGNYIRTKNGMVVIIDTDKLAMPEPQEVARLEADWIEHGTRIYNGHGISMCPKLINDPSMKLELPMYSKWPNYDDQAYAYLSRKCKKREEYRLQLKQERA